MDRTVVPGLEVAPSMGPQVAAQLDENKYYIGSERWNFPGPDQLGYSDFDRPNQSNGKPQLKSQSFVKIIGVLIAVLLLAVALGVGLGFEDSSVEEVRVLILRSLPSDESIANEEANNTPVTVVKTSNAPIITQIVSNIDTTTPATATQSSQVNVITPTPDVLPHQSCPKTNGSTYTATKEISEADASQIDYPSLKFEILCDTTYDEGGAVMDIQLVANVSSLSDCLDLCALYDFQMRKENFPAHACTGASWAHDNDVTVSPRRICWLRNNVTLASSNKTSEHVGYDSGILLLDA